MVSLLIQLISVFAYDGNTSFSWDSQQSFPSELLMTFALGATRRADIQHD